MQNAQGIARSSSIGILLLTLCLSVGGFVAATHGALHREQRSASLIGIAGVMAVHAAVLLSFVLLAQDAEIIVVRSKSEEPTSRDPSAA